MTNAVRTIQTQRLMTIGALGLMALMISEPSFAGTGGDAFTDVWDTLKDWTQGTLGRIVAGAMVLVGIVGGIARQAGNTLDLSRLGLKMDDLNPLTLGEGKKKVVVFVDPRCPHCHELLKQALPLTKEYTFQILPVPVLGPDSERQVRQLGCARDKKAAADALLNGRIGNLEQDDACNLEPMQRTLVTAQILGIQGVPFIVANDGRISRGRPYDLSAWLEGR
ncbi:TraA family conjugative transfer protein [Escherichia coli]|uniref:TraA family conjugative transfer protein n=1 Tax=Escherichia coli TaxID=562 RepID=UPI000691B3C7